MVPPWTYLLDSEFRQHSRIEELREKVRREKFRSEETESRIVELERAVAELHLVNAALLELLEEHDVVDERKLGEAIRRLSLDGIGEIGAAAPESRPAEAVCVLCGQKLVPGRATCMYCGDAVVAAAVVARQ